MQVALAGACVEMQCMTWKCRKRRISPRCHVLTRRRRLRASAGACRRLVERLASHAEASCSAGQCARTFASSSRTLLAGAEPQPAVGAAEPAAAGAPPPPQLVSHTRMLRLPLPPQLCTWHRSWGQSAPRGRAGSARMGQASACMDPTDAWHRITCLHGGSVVVGSIRMPAREALAAGLEGG